MNISDRNKLLAIPPFLRLAFRPFFWLAALSACVLIGLWLAQLSGLLVIPRPSLWWHGHEMLFGFGIAVVCGFLLTAVQNWTGKPGLAGMPLLALVLLWLGARICLLLPLHWAIPAALDLAFNAGLVWALSRYLAGPGQAHNRLLLILPAFLTLLNGFSYWLLASGELGWARDLWLAVLVWFFMVMVIIGTRVIPFFIARRAESETPERNPLLMKATLAALLVTALCWLVGVTPDWWRWPAWVAALLLLWPLRIWYRPVVAREPLLWSLFLAWLTMPLGLALLAWKPQWLAVFLHLPAIGGMGLMMLSMMMRVSLGHSGRFVYGPPKLTWALWLVILAALVRVVMPWGLPAQSLLAWQLAGGLWIIAFGAFVIRFLPVLGSARVDGQPG